MARPVVEISVRRSPAGDGDVHPLAGVVFRWLPLAPSSRHSGWAPSNSRWGPPPTDQHGRSPYAAAEASGRESLCFGISKAVSAQVSTKTRLRSGRSREPFAVQAAQRRGAAGVNRVDMPDSRVNWPAIQEPWSRLNRRLLHGSRNCTRNTVIGCGGRLPEVSGGRALEH